MAGNRAKTFEERYTDIGDFRIKMKRFGKKYVVYAFLLPQTKVILAEEFYKFQEAEGAYYLLTRNIDLLKRATR